MYQSQSQNQSQGGINPLDLIETHTKKKEARLKIYEEIYEKCCQKIYYVNNTLYGKECKFEVPYVRWGLPFYHINAVLLYIMIKLRGQGFKVRTLPPNAIHIDWHNILETFSAPMEFKFEMDEPERTGTPNIKSVSVVGDDRFDDLDKNGCGGDCCKKRPEKPVSKKQRLELERQRQQDEIKSVLASKSKRGHAHSSTQKSRGGHRDRSNYY